MIAYLVMKHFDVDSSAILSGLASGLLTYCQKENNDYLQCKAKSEDPEKCLKEAIACRKCAFQL